MPKLQHIFLLLSSFLITNCSTYPTDINARLITAENDAAAAKAQSAEAMRIAEQALATSKKNASSRND